MRLAFPLVASALLFSLGVFGVLARRNAVLVLMSVELMLNGVNINLVAFDAWWADALHAGQVLTLFVITIAAAEVGVGLAIVLLVFRNRGTSDLDDLGLLDERTESVDGERRVGGGTLIVVPLIVLIPFASAFIGLAVGWNRLAARRLPVGAGTALGLAVYAAVAVWAGGPSVEIWGTVPDGLDPDHRRHPSRRARRNCGRHGDRRRRGPGLLDGVHAAGRRLARTPLWSRCSPRRCCSSSLQTTSSCSWSAGRSWASAQRC